MNTQDLIKVLKKGMKLNKDDSPDIRGLIIVEAMKAFGVDTDNWPHQGPTYQKGVRIGFNRALANKTLDHVVQVDVNSFYPRILLSLDIDQTLKDFVQLLLDLREEYKGIDKEKELLVKLAVNKLIGILGSEL